MPALTGPPMDPTPARPEPASPVLDAGLCAFIRQGVSIGVATRDASLRPHVVRALGCRHDGRRVVLFVPSGQAHAVLDDVAATGQVAVVFSQPSTHRTYQLKGRDACAVPLDEADRRLAFECSSAFAADLRSVGYSQAFTAALLRGLDDEIAGIAFTPAEAFEGTPGPRSGRPLRGAA